MAEFRYPTRWPTQADDLRVIMPGAPEETLNRVIELMDWRDRMLEDWLSNLGGVGGYSASFNGILVTGVRTTRYYAVDKALNISKFSSSLVTAGTTTTTLKCYTGTGTGSPTAAQTITLAPSTKYQEDTADIDLADNDYFLMEITTAGTEAVGLNIQVEMSEVTPT